MIQINKLNLDSKLDKAERKFLSDFGESTAKKLKNIGVNILNKVLMSMVFGFVPTY